MPLNLTVTLRKALRQLEAEKARLDRQIAAIQALLQGSDARPRGRPARKPVAAAAPRRRMSLKARQAARARMKAYWEKKKAEAGQKK